MILVNFKIQNTRYERYLKKFEIYKCEMDGNRSIHHVLNYPFFVIINDRNLKFELLLLNHLAVTFKP